MLIYCLLHMFCPLFTGHRSVSAIMGRYTLGSKPTHFFISFLIASSSSCGRSVIWWQLRAYLMLHSSFQSLIRNHFGMTEGMWYVICRVYLQPPINLPETNKLFFDISNFSDVFDEEHFINSLANDVKVEKKLPKELVKAPKSVRYFKSWSI